MSLRGAIRSTFSGPGPSGIGRNRHFWKPNPAWRPYGRRGVRRVRRKALTAKSEPRNYTTRNDVNQVVVEQCSGSRGWFSYPQPDNNPFPSQVAEPVHVLLHRIDVDPIGTGLNRRSDRQNRFHGVAGFDVT